MTTQAGIRTFCRLLICSYNDISLCAENEHKGTISWPFSREGGIICIPRGAPAVSLEKEVKALC
jgi:hypothetical protein